MAQNRDKRIDVRVQGRVQGVGFRWFVLREAQELHLRGWVRNAPDGSVEVRAAGAPDAIAFFRERLAQGPPAAQVTSIVDLPASSEPLPAEFGIAR
jgi:acylphosphatase